MKKIASIGIVFTVLISVCIVVTNEKGFNSRIVTKLEPTKSLGMMFDNINQRSTDQAEMPGWCPTNIWQYNMTIPSKLDPTGKPVRQTATIFVAGQGYYFADNGTEYRTFDAYYTTNTNETNEEYGFIHNRTQDHITVIMCNYKWAFSERETRLAKGTDIKNFTRIMKITKYDPWVDQYNFLIMVGNSWDQSVVMDITTTIYKYTEEGEEYKFDDSHTIDTITTYYRCTGVEPVTVTLADNKYYYKPNQTVNWATETFDGFAVYQDKESQDSDGCYIVEYWSEEVGNIVKKDIFKNHELYSTCSLVYYDYQYHYTPPIIENKAPIPSLEASETIIELGDVITFYAADSLDLDGNITKYYLDFGDGTNSGWVNTSEISHLYTTSGEYTVTLIVMDNEGTTSTSEAQLTIQVHTPGLFSLKNPFIYFIIAAIIGIAIVLIIFMLKMKKIEKS